MRRMAPTKPPHRTSKRPHSRPASHAKPDRPAPRPQGSGDARLSECEAAVVSLHADVDALRSEVSALRAELALAVARMRKLPPPLPAENWDEVISVDEREVILESIRPPRARR